MTDAKPIMYQISYSRLVVFAYVVGSISSVLTAAILYFSGHLK